jgi:hypothetical protein
MPPANLLTRQKNAYWTRAERIQTGDLLAAPGDVMRVRQVYRENDELVVVGPPGHVRRFAPDDKVNVVKRAADDNVEVDAPKQRYGCVMADVPSPTAASVALVLLRAEIDEVDFAGDGDDVENHVTLRYGLIGDTTAIAEYLRTLAPFDVTLGGITVFDPSQSSDGAAVVVVDAISPELVLIHQALAEHGNWKPADFDYHPHITVAYVKPEAAEKYRALEAPEDAVFTVSEIVISDAQKVEQVVALEGNQKQLAEKTAADHAEWDDYTITEPGREDQAISLWAENDFPVEGLKFLPIASVHQSNDAVPDVVAKTTAKLQSQRVFQAIVVRDVDGEFHVMDGNHRLQAAKDLGFDTVPAILIGQRKTAAPLHDEAKDRTFYHGTDSEAAAQSILANGIQPREITMPERAKSRESLAPAQGRVYITSELGYAAIYALGANMFGHESPRDMVEKDRKGRPSPYGYIFAIVGRDIAGDIVPDEDSIGGFISNVLSLQQNQRNLTRLKNSPKPPSEEIIAKQEHWLQADLDKPINRPEAAQVRSSLMAIADRVMTDRQREKVMHHRIDGQAAVGKKVQKHLTPLVIQWMLDHGAHAAHFGAVHPTHAWRFKKEDAAKVQEADVMSICEEIPLQIKTAAIAPSDRTLYRGVTNDTHGDDARLNAQGILWLAEQGPARQYILQYSPGTMFEVTLKPDANIVRLDDLSNPVVRAFKERASASRLARIGHPISDEEWPEWADFGMLEGNLPWSIQYFKRRGVDGLILHDHSWKEAHESLALLNRKAIESTKKEPVAAPKTSTKKPSLRERSKHKAAQAASSHFDQLALGTILSVAIGEGFAQKHYFVARAADGWHRVNEFGERGKEISGLLGESVDLSGLEITGAQKLHPGVAPGDMLSNQVQMACLPDGSVVRSFTETKTMEYVKQNGKWVSDEGTVESYHFSFGPGGWKHQWVSAPKTTAKNASADDLPPAPGTAPLPADTVRLYHYTRTPEMADAIRSQGLLAAKGRGDDGSYSGPSAGIWAATEPPNFSIKIVIEFWATREEISRNADYPRKEQSLEDFQASGAHVIMGGDVPPNQIVAIHYPWHSFAHMLVRDLLEVKQPNLFTDAFIEGLRGRDSHDNHAREALLWYRDKYMGGKAPKTAKLAYNEDAHLQTRDEYEAWKPGATDEQDRQRSHRRHEWDQSLMAALSTGKVKPEDCKNQYSIGLSGVGPKDFKPLPQTLYHVTTAASKVKANGLMSRFELAIGNGPGLSGGDDKSISFTTDLKIGEAILDAMLFARKTASGQLSIDQILKMVETGEGVGHPFMDKFMEGFNAYIGGGEREFQSYQRGMKQATGSLGSEPKDGTGWKPMESGAHWTGGDGVERYANWERPWTDQERRDATWSIMKTFLWARQQAGGKLDPLFFMTDTEALAKIPESEIALLQYKPAPGGMGTRSSGLGEVRTYSGKAVILVGEVPGPNKTAASADTPRSFPTFDEFVKHWGGIVGGLTSKVNAEELGDKLYPTWEKRYEDWVSFHREAEYPRAIYRAVRVPTAHDINVDKLGQCWSWDEEYALVYDHSGVGKNYIVRALAHFDDIDWMQTIHLNLEYDGNGIPEKEIRLKPKAPIEVVGVRPSNMSSFEPFHQKYVTSAKTALVPAAETKALEDILPRAGEEFDEWLSEQIGDDTNPSFEEVKQDRPLYLDYLRDWLQEAYSIGVEENGCCTFWKRDQETEELIGDLPVIVYHHTSSAILAKIKREGLRADVKRINPHQNSGAGVYVTTELSGAAVNGYHYHAVQKHKKNGDRITLSIKTYLADLEPDPDDQDISSGAVQFVLPYVAPEDLLWDASEKTARLKKAMNITVPPSEAEHFWEEPAPGMEEFWAFRWPVKAEVGDSIIFKLNQQPIAEAVVSRIEKPGEHECETTGRFRNQWKVYWTAESFKKIEVKTAAATAPMDRASFDAFVVRQFKEGAAEENGWKSPVMIHHGTDSVTAEKIRQAGFFHSGQEYPSFFTARKKEAIDYSRMRGKQLQDRGKPGEPYVFSLQVAPHAVTRNKGSDEIETHTRIPLYFEGSRGFIRDQDIIAAVQAWNPDDPASSYDAYLADFAKGGEVAQRISGNQLDGELMVPVVNNGKVVGEKALKDMGYWLLMGTYQYLRTKRDRKSRALYKKVEAWGMNMQTTHKPEGILETGVVKKMGTLAEAMVASFDSHPDVKWVQLASSEAKASFQVEGDTVQVHFQKTEESAWRVGFEVEKSAKSSTQMINNSVRILSGVFFAVREFLEVRQPERLIFASKNELLGNLYETYLSREGTTLRQIGYRVAPAMKASPLTEFQIEKTSPSDWQS